jgi:peptidoglycan/LPS O-acetylase OafA/YrhL
VAVVAVGAVAARATVGWTSYGLPFLDIGACLLVAAAVSDTELAGWLGSRPLVWLGQRSYSLYLWHIPVLYAVALSGLGLGQAARLLTLASSLGCAELSFRFVEGPFRRRRARATPAPVAAAESASA